MVQPCFNATFVKKIQSFWFIHKFIKFFFKSRSFDSSFCYLTPLLNQRQVKKKAHEKVNTDLIIIYWAFKTIELKIVSVPYFTNKFSDYFYWYFGTILLIFGLSRIRLVSSILHHVDWTTDKKGWNMFWKLENWFFQFDSKFDWFWQKSTWDSTGSDRNLPEIRLVLTDIFLRFDRFRHKSTWDSTGSSRNSTRDSTGS